MNLHYHKQAKLNPRRRPFICFSTWRGIAVIIGRREYGVNWK